MAWVVSLLGAAIAAIGLLGAVSPARMIGLITRLQPASRLWLAVGARLVIGVVFVLAADGCRMPQLVRVVGVIAIVAAAALALLGPRRFEAFVGWWLRRPASMIRSWAAVAVAFGALLIYAGA
jgi:hypothetical protein